MSAATNVSSISDAQLAANRANAQLSTGPTSDSGKTVVSQNAVKHGLTGKFTVLPSESQSDFDQLLAGFLNSENPAGAEEEQMVHQMAEALWLSRRCLRLQNDCLIALECGTAEEQKAAQKSFALYLRYQASHDRTFFRYTAELRKRRTERTRTQLGFVSQQLKQAVEKRRQEAHDNRQMLQHLRQEGVQERNRLIAAKAEALELKNLTRKPAVLAAQA